MSSAPTWSEKLAAIRTRHAAATRGPWKWFGFAPRPGRPGLRHIYLATIHGGRRYVLDFVRWGMSEAQPRFRRDNVMVKASDVAEHQHDDTNDIARLNAPDAAFLAESWSDVDALLARVDELEAKVAAQAAPRAPTVWQYVVRNDAGDWLADVVLRSDGSFFALSDWGGYGFRWTSTGSSCFRSWASLLDVGYVAGKLGVNTAKARVVDAFTAAVWPRLVLMLRAELAAEKQAQPQAVAS